MLIWPAAWRVRAESDAGHRPSAARILARLIGFRCRSFAGKGDGLFDHLAPRCRRLRSDARQQRVGDIAAPDAVLRDQQPRRAIDRCGNPDAGASGQLAKDSALQSRGTADIGGSAGNIGSADLCIAAGGFNALGKADAAKVCTRGSGLADFDRAGSPGILAFPSLILVFGKRIIHRAFGLNPVILLQVASHRRASGGTQCTAQNRAQSAAVAASNAVAKKAAEHAANNGTGNLFAARSRAAENAKPAPAITTQFAGAFWHGGGALDAAINGHCRGRSQYQGRRHCGARDVFQTDHSQSPFLLHGGYRCCACESESLMNGVQAGKGRPHKLREWDETMARKFFGTDGIRGRTNQGAMTAEMAMRVGQAAGAHFVRGDHRHRVVIGKDTRLSGYMIENALVAGFTSVGMDVVQVGPMPTPAVAMLVPSMRADLGVMISASHNPYFDNGIKLFGPDGYKLSDADESAIEALLDVAPALAESAKIGRARRVEDARGRYIHFAKSCFPDNLSLDGLKIVVDCAHGAAYQVAPSALWELGAEIVTIGVSPNGTNINDQCGSTAPLLLQETVVAAGADIGIALDGDADRLIIVDEKGQIIDGDQIMGLIGLSWSRKGRLQGGGVVATVMSNLGLERFLAGHKLGLERTAVGDRYVLERMRSGGFNVGGEQSGHMILSDYATTGDGLVAGLQVLAELVAQQRPASDLLNLFDPVPQLLKNVRFAGGKPLAAASVQAVIADVEAELAGRGRLVIRPSGTEPVIRVMAEGDDAAQVERVVDAICAAVKAATG